MVALAALAVSVVLLVAGILLGLSLRAALTDDLAQTALLRARDLATLAAGGTLTRPVPVGDSDEAFVQVVRDGEVIAASANLTGSLALDVTRPPEGQTRVTEVGDVPIEHDEGGGFLLAAATVRTPRGPVTAFVGVSLEDVNEAVAEAGGLGLAALPLLVAALSVAIWVIVGYTLAPVEAIRAEAEAISGTDLHRRLPEPVRRDEIGRLSRTLNAMLGRMEAAGERQRRFIADAAHELRSPIASLRAQLEADGARRHGRVAAGDDLLAETLRMQQLTEQLLLLARIDSGQLTLRQRAVDLDDLVSIVTSRFPGDSNVRIERADIEPVQISGDPVLLEQVIRNLVENARRHARTRVAISLRRRGDTAELIFDDNGPGIAPHDRDRVFERFSRLDDARARDSGGAGLGLAIVADIVAAHDGRVTVTDSPLGGARLEVVLPV